MTRKEEIYNQLVELFGAVDKQPKNFEGVFSKRQLNIAKEAEERYLSRPLHQYYSAEDLAKAFRDGAVWSDKNPVNVWHDVSEEPKINEDVVLYDCCGNFIAEFFDGSVTWRNIVLYYKATIWAYVKDLLPKGGEL